MRSGMHGGSKCKGCLQCESEGAREGDREERQRERERERETYSKNETKKERRTGRKNNAEKEESTKEQEGELVKISGVRPSFRSRRGNIKVLKSYSCTVKN